MNRILFKKVSVKKRKASLIDRNSSRKNVFYLQDIIYLTTATISYDYLVECFKTNESLKATKKGGKSHFGGCWNSRRSSRNEGNEKPGERKKLRNHKDEHNWVGSTTPSQKQCEQCTAKIDTRKHYLVPFEERPKVCLHSAYKSNRRYEEQRTQTVRKGKGGGGEEGAKDSHHTEGKKHTSDYGENHSKSETLSKRKTKIFKPALLLAPSVPEGPFWRSLCTRTNALSGSCG